jgi:hypothetical protein
MSVRLRRPDIAERSEMFDEPDLILGPLQLSVPESMP